MHVSLIHNFEEATIPKIKIESLKLVVDDPSIMLSKILENVIHLRHVSSYLRSIFYRIQLGLQPGHELQGKI